MPHTIQQRQTISKDSIGTWADDRYGHYLQAEVIKLAMHEFGFEVTDAEKWVVLSYDANYDKPDYPHEVLQFLCDDAIEFLNSDKGPIRPEVTHWGFIEGDFGLYYDIMFDIY